MSEVEELMVTYFHLQNVEKQINLFVGVKYGIFYRLA